MMSLAKHSILSKACLLMLYLASLLPLPAHSGPLKANILSYPFSTSKENGNALFAPVIDLLNSTGIELELVITDSYKEVLFAGISIKPDLIFAPSHISAILISKHDYELLWPMDNGSFNIYTHKDNDHINDLSKLKGQALISNDRYALSTAIAAITLNQELGLSFNHDYFYLPMGSIKRVLKNLSDNKYQYGALGTKGGMLASPKLFDQLKPIYNLGYSPGGALLINKKSILYQDKIHQLKRLCKTKEFLSTRKRIKDLSGSTILCADESLWSAETIQKYQSIFKMIQ